jgi:hypothetical protein
VVEAASRALRNYLKDPEKILIFSSVNFDPRLKRTLGLHKKFKNFIVNELDYALGYKKNMLFFFDYINNVYFGENIQYEKFKKLQKFIPTAARSIKKEFLVNQSNSYLKFLNKNFSGKGKFDLSNVYNFTLYSISLLKKGICIH